MTILLFIVILILGIMAGTFTGLTPGIHTNLIAILILPLALKSKLPDMVGLVFIVAMATTHTFVDFIPAIFLGAPDEDTGLGVLPGHEFLLMGQGHRALKLTLLGSMIATISLMFIAPIFILFVPKIYPLIQRMMAFFLIWMSVLLIYSEDESKIKAFLVFILAGFLGISTLNLNLNQPLLPLLTGLFGTSTIIHSIKSRTKIPEQKIEKLHLYKKDLIKPTLATILISPICSFFPGLGSSQAAIIGSRAAGKLNREQFLILMGSINTLVLSTSFITLFLFQKSRTGAAFAISQITNLTTIHLYVIIITIIVSAIIATPISIKISKNIAKNIHKIPYTKISFLILLFLIITITCFSGIFGLIILIVSTLLGLTCIEFQTRRSFLMGAILIPTIIYYLPF
ncbi:MAG: tripartite tricarboxylate transporter permease [Nanoarchaeota archaeon]|nr:tripartite tricarboxylate transporter permease [Nanoarchaeota archaeon]